MHKDLTSSQLLTSSTLKLLPLLPLNELDNGRFESIIISHNNVIRGMIVCMYLVYESIYLSLFKTIVLSFSTIFFQSLYVNLTEYDESMVDDVQ